MKLLNILGAVVVIHIAVLVLAVAIPGCRSTKKSAQPLGPVAESASANQTPVSSAPNLMDRDLNPPLATASSSTFDPNAPAMSNATAEGRYSPTRPSSPVGTMLTATSIPDSTPAVTPVTTYTVKGGDNLWTLAKRNAVSVRELAAANDLSPDSGLRVGQVLVIPGKVAEAPSPASISASMAAASTEYSSYTIRPGDTLAKIAKAHGSTVSKLKAFNNLTSDLVRAGDRLLIPESAAMASTSAAPTTGPASTSSAPPKTPAGTFKHTVASGESLTVIAQKYGVKIGDLALANQIRNPALIRPGQELIIPGWESTAKKPTSTRPASVASRAAQVAEDEDLDAGLDDASLDNVPVIQVEDPITTISTGNGSNSGPPLFN